MNPSVRDHKQVLVRMQGVGKKYRHHWVLKDINLTLSSGEILGFIGPNGAGKTTLMKIMAGLSRSSEGTVEVLGQHLHDQTPSTPDGIGLVFEQVGFIPYLSGYKNLEMLARIRNVADSCVIRDTLYDVGLDPHDARSVQSYSLGMRQRLGIAQALMEQPKLLLLDEPTNGLDPQGILELRTLLRKLVDKGVGLFMASHLLTEVEQVCDRVLFVRNGRIIHELDQTVTDMKRLRIVVSSVRDMDLLVQWADEYVISVDFLDHTVCTVIVQVSAHYPTPRIVRELVTRDIQIEEISQSRISLEKVFFQIIMSEASN
ncbi:MAG: hypothetical protein GFH27_549285n301 [Chloroflexi bacterium AL-W]|nr:hypothetical protein [Chloroflexi bacterium AL-N1]NOK65813.1 hypothetical protein [Chloroflexi bacterium AL-N10]NOK74246.1 hypothetical protein [Chloroflexi bacterium AL-N5]NOK80846.1 hypothetical protein [Chloroflexi bacterium AL-W]NOK88504.1 hypothetical protein [Chloroflexi bacterium AL-N15]